MIDKPENMTEPAHEIHVEGFDDPLYTIDGEATWFVDDHGTRWLRFADERGAKWAVPMHRVLAVKQRL